MTSHRTLILSLLLALPGVPWAVSSARGEGGVEPPVVPSGTRLEAARGLVLPVEPWAAWPTLEEVVGEPGWRQSTEPLCEDAFESQGFDLWSDERGVFVRPWRRCDPELLDRGCLGDGTSVWWNDGSGWQRFFSADTTLRSSAVYGQPGGDVLVTTDSCDLLRLDGADDATCLVAGSEDQVVHFAAVDGERAYLTRNNEVWSGQDGSWELLEALPRLPTDLWANEEVVVAAAVNAVYVRGAGDVAFRPLPGAPAGYYMAVWGFGAEDLWLGNTSGWLVHWDGAEWTHRPSGSIDGIAQLWGSDGVLFFRSTSTFGRVVAGDPEILFSTQSTYTNQLTPNTFLQSMWGSGPEEVFLSLDRGGVQSSCVAELLFFDGANVRFF